MTTHTTGGEEDRPANEPRQQRGAAGADLSRELFFEEVRRKAPVPGHVAVEAAVSSIMTRFLERLTTGEAHHLLKALPEPIRELLRPAVEVRYGPVEGFHRPELLAEVADELGVTPLDAEAICRAVFTAVRERLAAGEARSVGQQLPKDLRELWEAPPFGPATGAAIEASPEEARRKLLSEIEREPALPPGSSAADAFAAVMCTFARRLSAGEARHVELGLPATLRPLVTACMAHRDEPATALNRRQIVAELAEHLGTGVVEAEHLATTVFAAVRRILPDKDVHDVASQLPPELRSLWGSEY